MRGPKASRVPQGKHGENRREQGRAAGFPAVPNQQPSWEAARADGRQKKRHSEDGLMGGSPTTRSSRGLRSQPVCLRVLRVRGGAPRSASPAYRVLKTRPRLIGSPQNPCQARVLPPNSPTGCSAKSMITGEACAPGGAPRSASPAYRVLKRSSIDRFASGAGLLLSRVTGLKVAVSPNMPPAHRAATDLSVRNFAVLRGCWPAATLSGVAAKV
jgi:hypothetical protein